MRKHEKNIGKKVYFVRDGNTCGYNQYEIYDGLLVQVSKDKVKIYVESLNRVESVFLKSFNHIGNYRWLDYAWGYSKKNLYKFIENRKNRAKKSYYCFERQNKNLTSYTIQKDFSNGLVPWDYLEIDTEDNKYLHRYKNELERLFSYFSKDKMFKIRDTNTGKYETDTSIALYITKFYLQDKTKPYKVNIKFYHRDGHVNIHKFDKFVKTFNIIEGEKLYDR